MSLALRELVVRKHAITRTGCLDAYSQLKDSAWIARNETQI